VSDWGVEELDLDGYLKRIGVDRPNLRSIMAGHLANIPFENVDVYIGRVPQLDMASLQAKLVQRKRGGYCFEQNALYAAALERLGLEVTRLAARTRINTEKVRPRTHMMLLVTVDGEQWLTDVGFGSGLIEPMPLREHTMQQGGWTFRLVYEDEQWVLQSLTPKGWMDQYAFAIERLYPSDYDMANYYTAAWPRSAFVQRLVAQGRDDQEHRALAGTELTILGPEGERSKRTLTPEETVEVLRDQFGVELTDDELDRLIVKLSALGDVGL
jgi:N-hydroxyarylamine O-acetyltransferase